MLVNEMVIVFLCIFASLGLFAIIFCALYLMSDWNNVYKDKYNQLKVDEKERLKIVQELQKDIIDLVKENRTLKEQHRKCNND